MAIGSTYSKRKLLNRSMYVKIIQVERKFISLKEKIFRRTRQVLSQSKIGSVLKPSTYQMEVTLQHHKVNNESL